MTLILFSVPFCISVSHNFVRFSLFLLDLLHIV